MIRFLPWESETSVYEALPRYIGWAMDDATGRRASMCIDHATLLANSDNPAALMNIVTTQIEMALSVLRGEE